MLKYEYIAETKFYQTAALGNYTLQFVDSRTPSKSIVFLWEIWKPVRYNGSFRSLVHPNGNVTGSFTFAQHQHRLCGVQQKHAFANTLSVHKITSGISIPLDAGTGVPAEVSRGVHNAGNDPAGSTIPFDPPAPPADSPALPSSDHSDVDRRGPLVATSFSMSASELRRTPRPWLAAPVGLGVGTETAASAPLGCCCCDPHGRPGTNSFISRTDDADFTMLKPTHH